LALEGETLPDSAWQNQTDIKKVELAYQCIGREQWSTAVAILDSMGHRTVRMNRSGAWGDAFTPVLPAVVADECRSKGGVPAPKDPMRFEIGKKPYIGFARNGPWLFSFAAEGEELWSATHSHIGMFRCNDATATAKPLKSYEFERTTETGSTS